MSSFVAVIKKDLKGYFDQPAGYILVVVFTGLISYLYFRGALGSGEATLLPLFQLLPWWLALFVAASTMRLIAEEQRDGTLEILLTQPLRVWTVLAAKFIVGLMFVGTGIVATLGIPLMMQTAGDFDWGAIIAQYMGTFLLTGSFVAIGLFASSLTRNQIVAFITALAIIMGLMLAGLPLVTIALPSSVAALVQDLSPLSHFSGIARGVLDLRDVLYFVSLISVFMSGTYLMIRGKSVSHRSPLYRNLQLGVGGLVVLSLLIGWFGRSIGGRWDLTEQELYTLSSATGRILEDLDDIVTFRLYSSKEPPIQLASMTRELNHVVEDIAARSDGKVRIVRVFPGEDEAAKSEADNNYIRERRFNIETQGELRLTSGYLGLAMTYANKKEVLSSIDSLEGIEYRIMANVYRMIQKTPKTVTFFWGHGEKRRDAALQSFRDALERHHRVDELEEAPVLDLGMIDVLLVPGPTEVMDLYTRDQIHNLLSQGGKALILVDPVLVNSRDLSAEYNQFSLADFLIEYGIDIQDNLVYDTQSNEQVTFASRSGSTVELPYPYWVRVPISEKKISGGVSSVVLPWASSIELTEPLEKSGVSEVTQLLVTRSTAGLDQEYRDLFPDSVPQDGQVPEEELGERIMAVAITGTRCAPTEPKCDKDPNKLYRMIVATDSDWISERMVADNAYSGHVELAVNWIDWLTQDDSLATVRAKGASARPLVFDSDMHRNLVQYGNIIGLPVLFILLGTLRYLVRRRVMGKVYSIEG